MHAKTPSPSTQVTPQYGVRPADRLLLGTSQLIDYHWAPVSCSLLLSLLTFSAATTVPFLIYRTRNNAWLLILLELFLNACYGKVDILLNQWLYVLL